MLVQTGEILSVADGFAPLDVAPTGPTGDGEVGHVGGVGRTVPMPDARLDTNRVSLADPFDRSALGLGPAAAARHEEVLPCRVAIAISAIVTRPTIHPSGAAASWTSP